MSLAASRLTRQERVTAAWFGPKGFASVVYGLLILESGAPGAQQEFAIIAACVALSVLVHSSTDVSVARWLTSASESRPTGASRGPGEDG